MPLSPRALDHCAPVAGKNRNYITHAQRAGGNLGVALEGLQIECSSSEGVAIEVLVYDQEALIIKEAPILKEAILTFMEALSLKEAVIFVDSFRLK